MDILFCPRDGSCVWSMPLCLPSCLVPDLSPEVRSSGFYSLSCLTVDLHQMTVQTVLQCQNVEPGYLVISQILFPHHSVLPDRPSRLL